MGQAQINVRTWACSGTFIARTKQAALTHNVRGKRLISWTLHRRLCIDKETQPSLILNYLFANNAVAASF